MTLDPAVLTRTGRTLPVGDGLRLRRFGQAAADLDIDFGSPVPDLVTELIAVCGSRSDGGVLGRGPVRQLSLSIRTACLLTLARMEGVEALSLRLQCSDPSCSEAFELDVGIDEALAFAAADAEAEFEVSVGGATLRLRRPTGNDQLEWLGASFSTADLARLAILRSLVVSHLPFDLPADWSDGLEAALAEHDPLVCFTVQVVCPFCNVSYSHELPLANLAVSVLRAAQVRFIALVHRLASRYGWTEHDVLGLPAWRRDRYAALIASEAG